MSLDHIPGLGSLAPLAPRRSWLRLTLIALAMCACVAAGFALGRWEEEIVAWVGHVAPGSLRSPAEGPGTLPPTPLSHQQ